MAPPVLYRVIYGTTTPYDYQKALTTVRPALLQSYHRHKVKHADYQAILPHENGASVRGSLVTGLLDEDMRRLDIFEGDQYERKKVKVLVLKDTSLDEVIDEDDLGSITVGEAEAETYVWIDPREDLEEEEWDFEEFRREKMWAWVGEAERPWNAQNGGADGVVVDEGFADVDRDVAERERERKNDPTGGRGVNGKITKELERAAV